MNVDQRWSRAPGQWAVRTRDLTKSFGRTVAVAGLDLHVPVGAVHGFLGPNGSGKTTTLRMLLGLVKPTAGTATIDGRDHRDFPRPASVVGASLEATFHPGRTARDHLRTLAPLVGVDDRRCDEVLELVGLTGAADRKAGGFSLGMRQRLGLGATLLGDPPVLLLDEPVNGLDPAGIVWVRDLLRHLAGEGRTVLVSSHVLGEVQATVDDVVVIADGRLVHASDLATLMGLVAHHVRVRSPQFETVLDVAAGHGWDVDRSGPDLHVRGVDAATVGHELFAAGVEVHLLEQVTGSLEQTFLDVVEGRIAGSVPARTEGGGR